MALDEQRLLERIRRIEDYLGQVGQQIGVPFDPGGTPDVPSEVFDLVRDGDRMRAIQALVQAKGISLREAKAIVDEL